MVGKHDEGVENEWTSLEDTNLIRKDVSRVDVGPWLAKAICPFCVRVDRSE